MLGYRDPVADAIGLLRPRTVIGPSLRAEGAWGIRFERFTHVRIGGLVSGSCWLILDAFEPVFLQEGDTFMLGNPPAYALASSPDAETEDAAAVWDGAADGLVRIGDDPGEDDLYLCAGHISLDDDNAALLTDFLPPLLVVRRDDPDGDTLAQLISLLAAEVSVPAPGSPLVENHLAQILLVHMLRAHAARTAQPTGWLGALGDGGISDALRAIHGDVAHAWTLQELADISHQSRSSFAESFRRQVGVSPLEYVISWRMSLARDALARDALSIADLAVATGYRSESAFSTAFRRVVGSSPSAFRREKRRPAGERTVVPPG